jgi:hypothetical protein
VDISSILRDTAPDKSFWFNNGVVVRNIYELVKEIKVLSDYDFKYHSNEDHDDFAVWIGGALGDIWLSEKLRKSHSKKEHTRIIEERIHDLEKKNRILILKDNAGAVRKNIVQKIAEVFKDKSIIILRVILIILALSLMVASYLQYSSLQNLRALDERITYIERKNTCFNDYFNEQLINTKDFLINQSAIFDVDTECVYNYTTTTKANQELLESKPAEIKLNSIVSDNNRVVILVNDSFVSLFDNTSSMLPIINHNTKAIEIIPQSVNDLNIGDIVSYQKGTELIVHRIVDMGYDSDGYYAITRGDANLAVDPGKVRFKEIKGKIVVLIY